MELTLPQHLPMEPAEPPHNSLIPTQPISPVVQEVALTVSREIFGRATLERSKQGDYYRIRVPIRADVDPREGAMLLKRWLKTLRAAWPEFRGDEFVLDMDVE